MNPTTEDNKDGHYVVRDFVLFPDPQVGSREGHTFPELGLLRKRRSGSRGKCQETRQETCENEDRIHVKPPRRLRIPYVAGEEHTCTLASNSEIYDKSRHWTRVTGPKSSGRTKMAPQAC